MRLGEKLDMIATLGPGLYDPETIPRRTNSGVTMKAREKRLNDEMVLSEFPAPGEYNIPRSILRKKPYQTKGPMSCFANTVRKKEIPIKDKEKMKKNILAGSELTDYKGHREVYNPGPGDYEVAESQNFLRNYKPGSIEGSNSFNRNLKRFDFKKQGTSNPGPGSYNLKGEFEVTKKRVDGAVFMSETDRNPFDLKQVSDKFAPFYPSLKPSKESFHFNLKRQFIV